MARVTRSGTISRHLSEGGLHDLHLHEATQKAGPDGHEVDGFSTRQYRRGDVLLVVAGAFGPNWLRTLAEITSRLESPHVKCTVVDAPELGDHEVLVRWATSEELQARKAAAAKQQAALTAELARQEAQKRAEEERQALEAAGQSGLF
ncbi:hypothetical protein ACIBU0_42210 [Streptomyces sp. NPDC049627]|uniref:hypothetical protein n=1 Tax=Streptomyces sp. NPDC049627 TaxID=3365595 RepID=UPI0037BAED8B